MHLRGTSYAAVLGCVLLVLVGCEQDSPLAPDQPVRISASVVDPSGAPVEGVPVQVLAGVSAADFLLGPALPLCPPPCAGIDEERATDSSGRVVFDDQASSTQTPAGGARYLSLLVQDPEESGAPALGRGAVLHGFRLLVPTLELPRVPLWRTGVTATPDGPRLVLGFDPLPGVAGAAYGWRVEDLSGNLVTVATDVSPGSPVDARPLEDLPARMRVTARLTTQGPSGEVVTSWRSPVYAVRGTLAPPSRGAACSRTARDGTSLPVAPCPLTDGSPRSAVPAPADQCADVAEAERVPCRERSAAVTVDLGQERPVDLVVLRTAQGPTAVSTSRDGRSWEPFAEDEAATLFGARTVSLSAPSRRARFVRVDGGGLLTEVSVW